MLLSTCTALAATVPADAASVDTTTATAPTPEASAPATEASTPTTGTTTVPAPPSETPPPEPTTPATTTSTTPNPSTTPTTPTTTTEAAAIPAPVVRTQHSQPRTVVHVPAPTHTTSPSTKAEKEAKAVSPSALTPPLPSTLSASSFSGVPSFFINSFSIPPFLLPIYQAAGAAYGIPWQVLAAINEVETDYGRDLSISSAGAEGWMQFLPSEWGQYGMDVNDDGFEDPNNPADAIFAAARYLKQAGGDSDIRAAVFAYNHSQAYVNSVMLRARLLGGTPPELLGAVTGLTEGRFPVYAAAHYSDGFPTTEGPSPHTVAGTTIYSQTGAPAIAVQDGRIVQIDQSGPLGLSISLQDAYGNTYTYAGLGTLATLYPVLEAVESRPSAAHAPTAASTSVASAAATDATRVFRAGSDRVYLHPLRVGVHVIAGTVLGHLGAGVEPHAIFQIRPAGIGAPLIDPKPILDSWVKLQSSSVLKAKGRDPFAKITATPGQTLLESKTQLEQQLPRDHDIHLASCERHLIEDDRVDRRVLAALAFLSASGLAPTVSARSCSQASAVGVGPGQVGAVGAVDISAVNGIAIAGAPNSDASLTAVTLRKLEGLQGVMRPLQIASSTSLPGVANSVALPGYRGLIRVSFTSAGNSGAHAAAVTGSGLSPAQWLALVARLGEVPDPTVSSQPSPAAIPDRSNTASQGAGEGN
jgi:hypothetical protein